MLLFNNRIRVDAFTKKTQKQEGITINERICL